MSNKKKILFVNPHQFGHTTGYYYYCQYLKSEFDISFICFDKGLEKFKLDGVKVKYIHQKKNKLIRILYYLFKAVAETYKSEYSSIFVYSFYFSFIIGIFSRSKIKILDIRTGSISTNSKKRKLQNKFIKFQSLFFHKLIVLSKDLINLLKIPKSKSHLLPLGSEVFFEGEHNFEKLDLLYVGALNTRNIRQTVEGLYFFLKQVDFKIAPNYTIIGFGNNIEIEILKTTIKKYNLENYVSFEGRKNYKELPPYFENCNIGISWIPVTPAFNLQPATKTFEYILSGLFCIATSTKANKDLINSENGILCEDTPEAFAEALEKVYVDKSKFSSTQIRQTLEDYTWQNLVINNLLPFLNRL